MFCNQSISYDSIFFFAAFKAQFTAFIDKDNDGRASFKEIKSYLQKYDAAVTDKRVQDFVVRRDTNGISILWLLIHFT